MDILIHTLSGTTTAAFISTFSNSSRSTKLLWVLIGGFAGALPDMDAISLWSKFDGTIGKWLHLSHSGMEIYFGKFWYSHHGFFHSLIAALLLSFLFICIRKIVSKKTHWKEYVKLKETQFVFAVFFFAYVSHLIGDLPTPGAAWGGIRLFFPFEMYIGGYGATWWWNNYDVFLYLTIATLFFVLIILLENRFSKSDIIKFSLGLYIFSISLSTYSITHRSIDYAYTGNTSRYDYYERTSKMDQYNKLGSWTYGKMRKLDIKLPVYF